VRDRSAADRLRDAYLETVVDREADLRPGELYWHEVVGLRVRGTSGRDLGVVDEVYRVGETEAYVVRGGAVGEFDMPAIRDVIREISPERRELVVDDDVLDLESPGVDAPSAEKKRRPRWSRHGKGGHARPEGADAEGRTSPPPGDRDADPSSGSA
jgi:hypothetical protein